MEDANSTKIGSLDDGRSLQPERFMGTVVSRNYKFAFIRREGSEPENEKQLHSVSAEHYPRRRFRCGDRVSFEVRDDNPDKAYSILSLENVPRSDAEEEYDDIENRAAPWRRAMTVPASSYRRFGDIIPGTGNHGHLPSSDRERDFPCVANDLNCEVINKALSNESLRPLPEAFAKAMKGGSVDFVESENKFVIRGEVADERKLKELLDRSNKDGWTEWICGTRGWSLAPNLKEKRTYLIGFHRRIHAVYAKQMSFLLKHFDNPDDEGMRILVREFWYKLPTHQGKQVSRELLWIKANEKDSFQTAVLKLRPFLENYLMIQTEYEENWREKPSSFTIGDGRRWERGWELGHEQVKALMRSSSYGPDTPVQWAAHSPRNMYPKSVVTIETMEELVVGLANIVGFLCFDSFTTPLSTLEQVDSFLSSHDV